jgi:putative PIN family toxin of toxin-antitoxin system
MRVVLDTNVLVSGLAYPASVPGKIIGLWRQGGLNIVLSLYILNEVARVLPRLPKIRLDAGEIRELLEDLKFMADVVEPDAELDASLRDEKDQQVLATLRVSKAQYLITGDKDLLEMAERYSIVTPAGFWSRHG